MQAISANVICICDYSLPGVCVHTRLSNHYANLRALVAARHSPACLRRRSTNRCEQEIPIVFAGNKCELPREQHQVPKELVSNYVHYELPRLRAKVSRSAAN